MSAPRRFHAPSTARRHGGSTPRRKAVTDMAAHDAGQLRRDRRRRPVCGRHGRHADGARGSAGRCSSTATSSPATPSPRTSSSRTPWPSSTSSASATGSGPTHRLRPVEYSWRVLGHAVAGGFTPVGGHDRTYSIRRVSLDAAVVDTAVAGRGGGSLRDPGDLAPRVRHRATTRCAASSWRPASSCSRPGSSAPTAGRRLVARRLGLPKTQERRGEVSMLFAYWEGLPDSGWCHIDVQGRLSLMSSPCEDGIHLLSVAGPPELTRGSADAARGGLPRGPAAVPRGAQPAPARRRATGLPARRGPGDDAARVRPAGHGPGLGARR